MKVGGTGRTRWAERINRLASTQATPEPKDQWVECEKCHGRRCDACGGLGFILPGDKGLVFRSAMT
jgi:hypothetical protein